MKSSSSCSTPTSSWRRASDLFVPLCHLRTGLWIWRARRLKYNDRRASEQAGLLLLLCLREVKYILPPIGVKIMSKEDSSTTAPFCTNLRLDGDSARMDRRTVLLAGVFLASLLAVAPASGEMGYVVDWEAQGATFFDQFNFITSNDPSHGYVNYVNRTTALGTFFSHLSAPAVIVNSTNYPMPVNGSEGTDLGGRARTGQVYHRHHPCRA